MKKKYKNQYTESQKTKQKKPKKSYADKPDDLYQKFCRHNYHCFGVSINHNKHLVLSYFNELFFQRRNTPWECWLSLTLWLFRSSSLYIGKAVIFADVNEFDTSDCIICNLHKLPLVGAYGALQTKYTFCVKQIWVILKIIYTHFDIIALSSKVWHVSYNTYLISKLLSVTF